MSTALEDVKETTPAAILNNIMEDRRNLYWEKVGELVDGLMEDVVSHGDTTKIFLRTRTEVESQLAEACKAFMEAHRYDSFFAYVVLVNSHHATAGLKGPPYYSVVAKFPWARLAEKALYHDCRAILRTKDRFIALPQ